MAVGITPLNNGSAEPKGFFISGVLKLRTAILVDGGFFRKRYRYLVDKKSQHEPKKVADFLFKMAIDHLKAGEKDIDNVNHDSLYRIFYYDCPPFTKKVHNPVSGRCIDFSKSSVAVFQNELLAELRKKRKVAVRLGYLNDSKNWLIHPGKLKALLNKQEEFTDLAEDDVYYDLRQKAVDIRIGIDIASLAYKRQVQRIILVSGDSDFVPASKLARREGIDFILDPMWDHIKPDLFEHIDGLRSVIAKRGI